MLDATARGHNCNVRGCPICGAFVMRIERDNARAEVEALKDLLGRILSSSEDGSLWIPDVTHAVEATIKDALNGSLAPREERRG